MRRNLHTYTGDQWEYCDRCRNPRRIGPGKVELGIQLGKKVCFDPGCWDDLSAHEDNRDAIIQTVLEKGADTENVDDRAEYLYFAAYPDDHWW